ncbi:lipase/thioesterase family protein [Aspergillus pseudoustus]|uniref:Lipase/thioesterase family protein n=1 Tax=Aspergillus pseudoustus TaxID=1810923 RepID=A0ABR4IIT5_9EURO
MKPILTLWEKLAFFPASCSIVSAGVKALLIGFLKTPKPARSLLVYVKYAISREFLSQLSIRQLQAISPSTAEVYASLTDLDSKQSVSLGAGAIGHWIGPSEARSVLLWFHGGGFALPASHGHFAFLNGLREKARQSGTELSVLVLEYTLAPTAAYPTQLRQAVSCLRYVLHDTGHQPADVILGGDSAGGNLVFGVLSHLSQPHPHIEPLPVKGNLGGAVAIAPWVSLDTEVAADSSNVADDRGDIVSARVAKPWATAYLGGTRQDYYTDIASAPGDWCHGLPVHCVLVTAGANELLLGTLRTFAAKMRENFKRFEFYIGEGECHVAPIAHLTMDLDSKTEQGDRIETWLIHVLSRIQHGIQKGC